LWPQASDVNNKALSSDPGRGSSTQWKLGWIRAGEIEKCTGFETRVTVLGHVQRGGSPTAFDRVLGTRYGLKAVDLIEEGKLGHMVCLKGNRITSIPLGQAMTNLKFVDEDWIRTAEIFYG
jgi:6-phosphofructokinase 1